VHAVFVGAFDTRVPTGSTVGRYDHARACRSIRALRQNIPEADINRTSDIAQPEINFSWTWENETFGLVLGAMVFPSLKRNIPESNFTPFLSTTKSGSPLIRHSGHRCCR
jgi:hypothetical protein